MKVTLTLALALVTLLAPATAGAAERQARIYGGSQVADIGEVPFQAALVRHPLGADDGQFCGGTIRDAWHVITAAHCVYDNPYTEPGQAIDPADLDVLVGTADLADESAPAQRVRVAAVSFEPRYGSSSLYAYDAAVLTLAQPLTLGTGAVERAELVDVPISPASHPFLHVSGWGLNDGAHDPDLLREVHVPFKDDASCTAAWGSVIDGPVMICAGDDDHDSCNGDSGGPLSVDVHPRVPRLRLAGIVSFGPASGCGHPWLPGVYTEIDGPVRSFVDATAPTPAPRSLGGPAITGTARVGEPLTCAPGDWSESPTFSYVFARGATLLRGPSADPSYTLQPGDAGFRVSCAVKASNEGGYGITESVPSEPVAGAASAAPQPAPPATSAPPVAPPSPPVTTRPSAPLDRVAPVARIAKVTCSRSRCTLVARVRDAGFSSGVRRLEVKLVSTYRTRCTRGKRRVACTRIRARVLRAASLDATGFRVRVTGLPAGRHTFTLRAVDVAGNRQAIPARRTVRTSGRR